MKVNRPNRDAPIQLTFKIPTWLSVASEVLATRLGMNRSEFIREMLTETVQLYFSQEEIDRLLEPPKPHGQGKVKIVGKDANNQGPESKAPKSTP